MSSSEPSTHDDVVYKILGDAEWQAAQRAGLYGGSADDTRDGYIHLSTAGQLAGTVARHFRGQDNLVLVAISAARLGPSLRWEPSRGGDLFPHLYGPLDTSAAIGAQTLPLGPDGIPRLPEGIAP